MPCWIAWSNLKSWMELNFLAVNMKRKQRSLCLVNLNFWIGLLVFLAACSHSSVKSLSVIFVGLSVWPIDSPSWDKCLSVAPPGERETSISFQTVLKEWSTCITSCFNYFYPLYFSVDQFLLRQLLSWCKMRQHAFWLGRDDTIISHPFWLPFTGFLSVSGSS